MAYVAPKPGASNANTQQAVGDPSTGGTQQLSLQTPTGVSLLTAPLEPSDASIGYFFTWLLAWGVFIIILVFINKTKLGHSLIYYALMLSVFFVLVTEYKWIAQVMAPITNIGKTPQEVAAQVGAAAAAGVQGH